jgi:hypothetical protein
MNFDLLVINALLKSFYIPSALLILTMFGQFSLYKNRLADRLGKYLRNTFNQKV